MRLLSCLLEKILDGLFDFFFVPAGDIDFGVVREESLGDDDNQRFENCRGC